MAVKRLTSQKVAEQRTYEKLRRDLDVLPPNRPGHGRKQAEMGVIKVRMASRSVGRGV